MVGREDCNSLFTHFKNKKVAADKFLVRHFLAIQQATELRELDNVYCVPGPGNPADGLTKTNSDLAPRLRRLESGSYNPGPLRTLLGAPFRGS